MRLPGQHLGGDEVRIKDSRLYLPPFRRRWSERRSPSWKNENQFTAFFWGKYFPSHGVKSFSPENDFPFCFLPNSVE